MSFDLLRELGLKSLEQQLQAEVKAGGGPILDLVKPIVTPIIQAELAKAEGQVLDAVQEKVNGITNAA